MTLSQISTRFVSIVFVAFLVFPSLFPLVKLLLLVLAAAFVFSSSGIKKRTCFPFFKIFSFYFILLLPFFIASFVNNQPGALPLALSFLIFPFVFYVLLSLLTGILSIKLIIKLVSFSAPLILLSQIIGYQSIFVRSFLQARSGTIYDSTSILASSFSYSGTKSLYFIVPFISACLTTFLLKPINTYPSISIKFLLFCLSAGVISLFLSFEGTSFGIIAVSLLPLFLFVVNLFANLAFSFKIKLNEAISFVILFVFAGIVYYVSYEYLYSLLFDRLLTTNPTDSGDITRSILFQEHFRNFLQSPFLGNGIGFDNGLGRSSDAPWASELTYASSLSQYGLVGMFIYINYIGLFFVKVLKAVISNFTLLFDYYQAPFLLSYVYGIFSSLVAAINNPSLGSAENLFIFLIPVLSYKQIFDLKKSTQ